MATLEAPAMAVAGLSAPDSDWAAFFKETGRVPALGDKRPPWEYPGWLSYYLILAESKVSEAPRWDYWFRTMLAGRLLDEPIPQIRFDYRAVGERSEGYKEFDSWTQIIDRDFGRSPLHDLLDWLLWGLGLEQQMPVLNAEMHEALYRKVNIIPFLVKPYDYIGEWIANHKGRWNPHAFFPTPHSVCHVMTEINFSGIPPEISRGQSVCDPALGSARMLLQASNHSLCLYGCDIDPLMVKVSKVNGALYAPWMVRPFPAEFFDSDLPGLGIEQRDSIRNPPMNQENE